MANPSQNNQGSLALTTPYLGGAIAVVFLGMAWNHMVLKGETRIQPLPATCNAYVNDGSWVAINGCDEGSRGEAYRSLGIFPETMCAPGENGGHVWGWKDQDPKKHCRFKQRDAKSLKNFLQGRTIYFVGDSVTRYVYHSFCRQLGIKDSGAYDATLEKHQDIRQKVGDITVDFMWAGYSSELVETSRDLLKLPEVESDPNKLKRPDLVVFGGGAWDKLWEYDTDDKKAQVKLNFGALADSMVQFKTLGIPTVWVIPTTINTAALPSAEKRDNINEEEMQKFRIDQRDTGVASAASFTIDGPAFTSGRVSESYDGVHYPHQVYSAGAQILANAVDWLLPDPLPKTPKAPPEPGSMAHPKLGLMILAFAFFGVVGFDGFMGFSYVSAIFFPHMAPYRLYYEAFSSLHKRKNLPPVGGNGSAGTPTNATDPEKDDEETGPLLQEREEEVSTPLSKES